MSTHDTKPEDADLARAFSDFIDAYDFPCVGAKSALAKDQIDFAFAGDIRSNRNDVATAQSLGAFAKTYTAEPVIFRSFVVIFRDQGFLTETEFEQHMWRRLQSYSDKDSLLGSRPDPRVAPDPADRHFGLSFGGEAFFVVGLHPGASRPGRRFQRAALVFNTHDQFTRLRAENRYERMRQTIVDRDIKFAGTPNPMLARHGETSEARQYSGRNVADGWKCPFERRDFAWKKASEPA